MLLDYIAVNGLKFGDRLPPERSLAKLLDCSSITLRRALHELEERGVIESRHGSGTYIRQNFLPEDGGPFVLGLAVRRKESDSADDSPFSELHRFMMKRGVRVESMPVYGWNNDVFKAARGALGIIVVGNVTREFVNSLKILNLPIIVAGVMNRKCDVPVVDIAPDDEAYRLTKIFISRGCRRIYALGLSDNYPPNEKHRKGYEKAMKEAGLEPVVQTFTSHETRYPEMDRFLASEPAPDAVIGMVTAMTFHYQLWCQNHPDYARVPIGILEWTQWQQIVPYASERMLWSCYTPVEVVAGKMLLDYLYEGKELHSIRLKSEIYGVGVPVSAPVRVGYNLPDETTSNMAARP